VDGIDNSTIKTYVTGYDERPWPDVGFTVTLTDQLLTQPLLHANSSSSVDASGFDEVLAGIFSVLAFGLSIFPPLTFLLLNDIEAAEIQPNSTPGGGAGAGIVSLLPNAIPLPHTGGVEVGTVGVLARESTLARVHSPFDIQRTKLVVDYDKIIAND